MAVALGVLPRRTEYEFREISFDRDLTPIFGGDETRVRRLGTRHALDVTIPAIAAAGCGAGLIADISRGRSEGAVLAIPEPGLVVSAYGTPRVNGAGVLGSSLPIDGLPASKVIPKGKWFSVIISGRRYAYFTTASVTASVGGAATLAIYPMIRAAAPDNAVVELAVPMIEGLIQTAPNWSVKSLGSMALNFSVRETK